MLEEVGGRVEIRSKPWRGRSTSQDAPRPLSLIPAGSGAYGQATGVRFIRHLMLQFDGAALARMLEDEVDFSSAFAPRLMFSHPGITHLAHLFAEECASGEPKSQLYGDTLSVALVLALSRLNTSKNQSNKRGQLAPWQIRRVTEYFAAHLAEDVQLQTVCDLVKLSRSYFSRAFKMSTGLAPHQWQRSPSSPSAPRDSRGTASRGRKTRAGQRGAPPSSIRTARRRGPAHRR